MAGHAKHGTSLVSIEATAEPQWWADLRGVEKQEDPPRPNEFTLMMYAAKYMIKIHVARYAIDKLRRENKLASRLIGRTTWYSVRQ